MRWAKGDKESAKSRNENPVHTKKGSRSTTQQIPALAHRSPGKAGRNDDKEGFLVFDEGILRVPLSLNSCLSNKLPGAFIKRAPLQHIRS